MRATDLRSYVAAFFGREVTALELVSRF